MKKLLPLLIISLILFLLATAFIATIVIDVLMLPEEPEPGGEALGVGLTRAFGLVFVIIASIANAVAALLSLIGLLLAHRRAAGRRATVLFAIFTALPLVLSALAILLIMP